MKHDDLTERILAGFMPHVTDEEVTSALEKFGRVEYLPDAIWRLYPDSREQDEEFW
jgi:hypothetical protein